MRRACVIALLPLLLASARADDKPTLQTILDAWKAREKSIQSFDVRWWSKRFESGALNIRARVEAAERHVAIPQVPDASYIAQYRFLADENGRCRFDEKGQEWVTDKADFASNTHIDIFDGTTRKSRFTGGAPGFPIFSISNNSKNYQGKVLWVYPLTMSFRPIDDQNGVFNSKRLTFANETLKLQNETLFAVNDADVKIWVDPSKEFLPVRYSDAVKGQNQIQIDVAYIHDESCGWAPHSWIIDLRDARGNLQISESATVTRFSINRPIANSEFELDDFSAGGYVDDQTKNEQYILRPDGTRRAIPRGKFDANTYQELLKSEPDSK
jgi:hypothetical protein